LSYYKHLHNAFGRILSKQQCLLQKP